MDPAQGPDDAATATEMLAVGTRVEVRNSFDRSWSQGFTVTSTTPLGYRLVRRIDGTELPDTFATSDVRRERRRSTWWV